MCFSPSNQITGATIHDSDQQFKDADDIFGDPLQEEIIGTRKSSSIHRSKRRGKRNHSRGNFRGNLRTSARSKRLKFIDFDAPQVSQTL